MPQLQRVFEAQHDNAAHIKAYHDAAIAHFDALAGRADGAIAGARQAGFGNSALAAEVAAGNKGLLANQPHGLGGLPLGQRRFAGRAGGAGLSVARVPSVQ